MLTIVATATIAGLLAFAPPAHAAFVPGEGSGAEQALRDFAIELESARVSRLPVAIQYGAPSSNPASPALVDRADPGGGLFATIDQALGDPDNAQAFTVGVSPKALAVPGMPAATSDVLWRALRRTALNLTFGGPSQRVAPLANDPTIDMGDHLTADVRLRLAGSRDPEDHAAGLRPEIALDPDDHALTALMKSDEYRARAPAEADEASRYDALAAALRSHPDEADALLAEEPGLTDSARALREQVERSFLLGLSVTADMYSTGFGKDLYTATLIGENARGVPLTFNLGARAHERVRHVRDSECKLGLGTSHRWLPGRGPLDPLDMTVAGSVLLRDHDQPTLWLGNVKLDASLRPGFVLTTAVTFSDHPERVGVAATRYTAGLSYRILGSTW